MYLKEGTLLQGGTYKVIRFIKSGGFGCTYEAVHQLLNKRVAIKEFFVKDFCNREETGRITVGTLSKVTLVERLKQKFISEASSLSALDHEGIVNVSNLFLENDTAYYVMDYIDGCSLDVYVQQNGPLSEAVALDYIGQACEALKYVHDKNILHLDVKPGNLMLDKDGKVTLIDFGTSKQYDECDGENTSTLLGNTPGYASPEQGNSKVTSFTPATDVYSLGATLYKLLTGITPPTASERSSGEELDPLPENISMSTAGAIMKAMILNKKERLQSVGEFQSMLVSEIDGGTPPAVEDAAVVGSCPEDDDECTVYTGGDAGAPVVVVESGQQAAEPSFVPVPKKKSRRWLWWLFAAVILFVAGVVALMSSRSGGEATVASTAERAVPQHEIDKAAYDSLMAEVSSITLDDIESCNKAIKLNGEALVYEEKYVATEYRSMFSEGASEQILIACIAAEKFEAEAEAQKAKAGQERKQYEADLKDYNAKMGDADKKSRSDERSWKEAKKLYEEAAKYETRYKGTEYASSFVKGAAGRAKDMQILIDNMQKSNKQPSPSPSPKPSSSSSTASQTGTHKGHEWVDLGLSVKWATCNVGASTPDDYGNYYAWGETSTKSNYDYGNCASIGKSWGDIGGDSSRDAAKANWGGSWRMPTEAEFRELINNCTWTWTTHNGHKGYKVTGPNGNSIFLPAAGYRLGDTLCLGGEYGNYSSSTPNDLGTIYAFILRFDKDGWGPGWNARDNGRSVRPVLED